MGPTLAREDINEVSAAIAHIISAMPSAEAPQALWLFCQPIVESVHRVASAPQQVDKATLTATADALERLDTFLSIVGQFPELPKECAQTVRDVWSVLDALLERYGSSPSIAERSCTVIRRGLQFFDSLALTVAVDVCRRMTVCFEQSGGACYLWITGKVAGQLAGGADQALIDALGVAFERESAKVFEMLQTSGPAAMPDGEWHV